MIKFKKVNLHDTIQIASDISEDKQAGTIIFTNLGASLGGIKNEPNVSTKQFTLTIKMDQDNSSDYCIKQSIAGFVSVDQGTRAVLIAHLNGKTILKNFEASECEEGNDKDFEESIDTPITGAEYKATFFLIAERDSSDKEASCNLVVDSLDLELQAVPSKAKS